MTTPIHADAAVADGRRDDRRPSGSDGTPATRALSVEAWSTASTASDGRADSLVTTKANRWTEAGTASIYLAGDPGVALAEWGRHWIDGATSVALWRVRLELSSVVDLRQEWRDYRSGPDGLTWVLDEDRCRWVAGQMRAAGVEAVIVPSVAFLDDPRRGNAVVFVDGLRTPLDQAVRLERCVAQLAIVTDPGSAEDAAKNPEEQR